MTAHSTIQCNMVFLFIVDEFIVTVIRIRTRLSKPKHMLPFFYSIYTHCRAHTVDLIKEGNNEAVEIPQV